MTHKYENMVKGWESQCHLGCCAFLGWEALEDFLVKFCIEVHKQKMCINHNYGAQ